MGVPALDSATTHSVIALLAHPVVGVVLGAAAGAVLLLVSRVSFRGMTAAAPEAGLALAAGALLGRLAGATVLLYLYHRFVPQGFAPFGLALAGAFLVLYSVELVRFAGLGRYARPNRARG